jgi:hypothetical protein
MNKKLLEKDKKYKTKEGYVGLQARRQSIVFEKKKREDMSYKLKDNAPSSSMITSHIR